MNRLLKLLALSLVSLTLFFSCEKQTLTLDEKTSMKTLLKASDNEITELIIEKAKEMDVSEESVKVEYILRDEKNQAIAVKLRIQEQ